MPPRQVLAQGDQAIGTGLGQPVHLAHLGRGELDAVGHQFLALRVITALAGGAVQQLAGDVGLLQRAGRLVLEAVEAAFAAAVAQRLPFGRRSEEHTSELQSLMRISYAVFCLQKKKTNSDTTMPTT